ncbi:MAG: glycosyltransferase family 39 protein [Planctomycetes bacterium]|nr:glycosyltransferase family 39 protein [Planctomycetota bacterium]
MTDFLAFILIAFVMTTLGRAVLGRMRLRCEEAVERLTLSLAVGWMLVSHGLFALGWFGLFDPTVVGGLLLLLGILLAPAIGLVIDDLSLLLRGIGRASGLARPAVAFGGLVAALALVYALTPSTAVDESVYHYLVPRVYARAGGIVRRWDLFHSNWLPQAAHMPLVAAFLVGGETLANLFRPLAGLLLLGATVSLATRFYSRSTARLAGVAILATPYTLLFFRAFYVEALSAAYLLVAVYCFFRWMDRGRRRWLALAAALAGFMVGMKPTNLPAALVLIVAAGAFGLRGRRPHLGSAALNVLTALFWTAAAAATWYAKNYAFTGDPLYPHLVADAPFRPGAHAATTPGVRLARAMEPSWLRSYLATVLLGDDTQPELSFGLLGLTLAPLALLFRPAGPRLRLPLATAGVGFLALYVLTSPQPRYLYPYWCLLMIPAADVAVRLLQRSRLVGTVVALLVAAQCALAAGGELPRAWKHAQVLLGDVTPDDFRRLHEMPIRCVRWLNARLGPEEKVLAASDRLLQLDAPFVKLEDGYFAPEDLTPDRFAERLRQEGVTHVLVDSVFFGQKPNRRMIPAFATVIQLADRGVLARVPEACDATPGRTFDVYRVR